VGALGRLNTLIDLTLHCQTPEVSVVLRSIYPTNNMRLIGLGRRLFCVFEVEMHPSGPCCGVHTFTLLVLLPATMVLLPGVSVFLYCLL
jgi:hypothetical protein